MIKADGIDKFLVIAAVCVLFQQTDRRFQTQVEIIGQFHRQWKNHAAFDRVISQVIRAGREFDEWQERKCRFPAVIAPQIDFQPRCEIAETGLSDRRAGGNGI